MMNNEDLKLIDKDTLYDWIYIDDAINGIMKVIELGKNYEDYYIGNNVRRFEDIIVDVKKAINSGSNLFFGEFEEKSFINYDKIDIQRLNKDTNFSIKTDFSKTILLTAKWIQENNIGE